MSWRWNPDERSRRAARKDDPQAVAYWIRSRMRAGALPAENVVMAAYLGNESAQLIGLPLPGQLQGEPWGVGGYASRAHEILSRGPCSPYQASMFACDVAARALTRYGLLYARRRVTPVEDMLRARDLLAVTRNWISGLGVEDPTDEEGHEFLRLMRPGHVSRADHSAYLCLEAAVEGSRRQPADVTKAVVAHALHAARHATLGPGIRMADAGTAEQEAAAAAVYNEGVWQDAHFAAALLSERWPVVELVI